MKAIVMPAATPIHLASAIFFRWLRFGLHGHGGSFGFAVLLLLVLVFAAVLWAVRSRAS